MINNNYEMSPNFVYEFKNSYVELGNNQYFEGYCILFAKERFEHLSDMPFGLRSEYLNEMAILGEVMLEVLGAIRINYNILGNTLHLVHAHLFPRYEWEDETLRKTVVWKYDANFFTDAKYAFDINKHRQIKENLALALDRRYKEYLVTKKGFICHN